MSWTFVACVLISFAWMGLFFLWGRSFLTFINAERGAASSIVFGYLVLQSFYQVLYLPFFLTRGSYRALSFTWIGLVIIVSISLAQYIYKHPTENRNQKSRREKAGILLASIIILSLAIYIALHVPYYGRDTITYISEMNQNYYRDTMWVDSGMLYLHSGICSMFELFTTTSILTGIKPYYISLFTVRVIGICLIAFVVYRTGVIVFGKQSSFCWSALVLSVLAPTLLMFWGSQYTAEFFYWRINEAKGYGQFILLPIGFSIFLDMLRKNAERKVLWKEQFVIGLAAIPVSASMLTPYIFLLLMGTISLLAYDKFRKGLKTIGQSIICALPNIFYLIIYMLASKNLIVL